MLVASNKHYKNSPRDKVNYYYQLSLLRKLATVKSLKANVSSVSLRQSGWRNCRLCVGSNAESRATLLMGIWWQENKNKLVRWKALARKRNFDSRVLRPSELSRCRKRPQTAICCLEWLRRLKSLATGLDDSLSFLSTSRRCYRNRSSSRLPVSPMCNFLQ